MTSANERNDALPENEPERLPQGYAPRLDTRSVRWSSLRPHPENAWNGDTDAIRESVDANGVYRPVVVAREGTILAGHHLYYVLGEDGSDPMVDVVVIDCDPYSDKARRIMVADNRTASLGRYDDAAHLRLLDALRESDTGLLGTGYEDEDVDELAAAIRRAEHTPLGYKEEERAPLPDGREPVSGTAGEHDGPTPAQGGALQDDAARYESKGLRYVTIEYPVAIYPAVIAALGEQRKALGVDSNAEVVMRLLGVEGTL